MNYKSQINYPAVSGRVINIITSHRRTTPWMEEVESRREQRPRPVSTNDLLDFGIRRNDEIRSKLRGIKPSEIKPQHQQKGAGLMEVLIALLVLSIGILGLATLQSIGLKYNHQSYQRTQAIMQIYDIADRIRSNSVGRTTEYTNIPMGPPIGSPIGALGTDCTVVLCDSNQRATFDIWRWQNSLRNFLGPSAQGGISLDAGTRLHTIQVDWMENDVQKSFVYEAQLLSLI